MREVSFEEICKAIKKFKLSGFDLVVGIASGGVVPAGLLAYKLGCGLSVIRLNYRDKNNKPKYARPQVFKNTVLPAGAKRILLVDDVSVSGKTIRTAKGLFKNYRIKTFVLKGKADYVLFPKYDDCVKWPWKDHEK
ncbi:MAG: phosphoribosyltransferase family protein [Candidatus Omnitrophica bacterium]|nr:phosphoribosyltransferase family protein [Candidatus Omnitrophota bacterium]